MNCSVCIVGLLEEKQEIFTKKVLEVYEISVATTFFCCNLCGASIIKKQDQDKLKKDLDLKANQLYYN